MEAWDEPDSLLAPLIVGVHKDEDDNAYFVSRTLYGAFQSIPTTTIQRLIKEPMKIKQTQKTYGQSMVWLMGDAAKPYLRRVRLVQVPPGQAPTKVGQGLVVWEVGYLQLNDGVAEPAIGKDLIAVILEVTTFQAQGGVVLGAPQLALLRHLWVEGMRSYDPDLVVVGGQTRFEEHWWRSADEHRAEQAAGA
jgi:hypothetical protein